MDDEMSLTVITQEETSLTQEDRNQDEKNQDNFSVNDDIDWTEAAILADVAHVLKDEPLVTEPASKKDDVDDDDNKIAKKHELFQMFCRDQIFGRAKGWDTTKTLPWKTDSQLHIICNENLISKQQAAMWWLQLRRSHGRLEDIRVAGTCVNFKTQFENFTSGAVLETIQSSAMLECTERFEHLVDEDVEMKRLIETIFGNKNANDLRDLIMERVSQYNRNLAKQFVGMSVDNKQDRMGKFLKWWQKSIDYFVKLCHNEYFPTISISDKSRHIFVCLENDVYKAWNKSMNSFLLPNLVTEVADHQIETVVLNAGGLLYYISGWLLLQLQNARGKAWKTYADRFVMYNSLRVDTDIRPKLPDGVLTTREKHHGKLKRVGPQFFRFVQIIEVIYKVNLENPHIIWAFKDNLFTKLLKVTTQSFQIESAFNKCLPPPSTTTTNNNEEGNARNILSYLLQKYNTMRAGDFLKKLKAKAASKGYSEDNFSVRSALVVAHMMASGKSPSAIS